MPPAASPARSFPSSPRPSAFAAPRRRASLALSAKDRAIIEREVAKGPLPADELARDLRSSAQVGLPGVSGTGNAAPVHAKSLRRLWRAERRLVHPHLAMSVSWVGEWVTGHCDWNTGILAGVTRGAIVDGAQKLAAAEGKALSERSVYEAIKILRDYGAMHVTRIHGRGQKGDVAAMPCRHSRPYCIALTKRSGGKRHCAWHHGVGVYELAIRTPGDFRALVTGRHAARRARSAGTAGGSNGPGPQGLVASRAQDHAFQENKSIAALSICRGDSPPPRSAPPPRVAAPSALVVPAASPPCDVSPSATGLTFPSLDPRSNEAHTVRAVGMGAAGHGPSQDMSVSADRTCAKTESKPQSESETVLDDATREAAGRVLEVYRRTFAPTERGRAPRYGQLECIAAAMARGFTVGQLSLAVAQSSRSHFHERTLSQVMRPAVVNKMLDLAHAAGLQLPPQTDAAGDGQRPGEAPDAAWYRTKMRAASAPSSRAFVQVPGDLRADGTTVPAAKMPRALTRGEETRLKELAAARLRAFEAEDRELVDLIAEAVAEVHAKAKRGDEP